jgi:HSP20 family protein
MSTFLTRFGGGGGLRRFDPFFDLHREVNRLFDESFRSLRGREGGESFLNVPDIDVHETKDGLEVTAELPGVSEDDIDLRLDGDMLTIRGEKRNEHKDEKAHFTERTYGSFTRTVQLPFAPDPDKVSADCERGLLRIRLPQGAEQDRTRRIAIGKGQGQAIEGQKTSGQPAIGKDWSKDQAGTEDEKAEKGQGAPA